MAGKKNIFANFLSKSDAQVDDPEEVKLEETESEEEKPAEGGNAPLETATGVVADEAADAADPEDAGSKDFAEVSEGEELDEVSKLKRECESKDARIAELEKQVASLEDNIAQWSANLSVVKQGYEALEQKLAAAQKDRNHLDAVRLSLERANARLVEQNNLFRSGVEEVEHDEGEADADDATATVKYEVLYTPPDPEMHESLEGSDFFTEGGEIKPPEFRMPGSGLFRR